MRGRIRLLFVAGALGLIAGGCSYFIQRGPEPYRAPGVNPSVTQADLGRVLFDRDCAWCHGPQGQGTKYGPNLDGALDGGAYTDFMLRTGRMPLPAPGVTAVRRSPQYSEKEIAAIVSYVSSFGGTGPGVQSPDPAAGDLSKGAELYLQNCAACHSTTGIGGALTSGQVVPPLYQATAREIAEAALVGPGCPNTSATCGPGEGAMPRFDLTPAQIDSLVRYVGYLQDPRDTGGAAVGHVGPVAEGAIGLVVGLGIMLLVSRWIGTRAGEE